MKTSSSRGEFAIRSGILALLKPPGMTSHDAVAWLRRISGERRVGHAGTLDPDAAGVLPLCIGWATRLTEYLMESDKAYRADICLGTATDTGDASGQTTAERSAAHVTMADVGRALARFLGPVAQIPPMVSAVKVGGERLYRLARAGTIVERPPRRVIIHSLRLVEYRSGSGMSAPRVTVDILCSKGTYIRVLAEDVARELGTVAHLGFLLRTRAGGFSLSQAYTVEEVESRGWETCLFSPSRAVDSIQAVLITDQAALAVRRSGLLLGVDRPSSAGLYRLETSSGDLVAVAQLDSRGLWRAKKVFPSESVEG